MENLPDNWEPSHYAERKESHFLSNVYSIWCEQIDEEVYVCGYKTRYCHNCPFCGAEIEYPE